MSETSTSILDGPAMEAPAGQTSDFDHPGGSHELGESIVMFCGIVGLLASLCRLYARLFLKPRAIKADDALLVCALGLFSGFCYLLYKMAIYPGFMVHQWNIRVRDMENFLWRLHLASNFYGLILLCLKMAILLDWLHLFNPLKQRNTMFWTIHILALVNTIYYLAAFFLDTFRCSPQQKQWDPLYVGGRCYIDADALNVVASLLNLISDVAILALPQWIIWRMHLSRAKKTGVSLLFVIGILATICGIARMVYSVQSLHTTDYTYVYTVVGMWSLGEITAGFLIIGVPAVPKIYHSVTLSPRSAMHTIRTILTRGSGSAKPTGAAELRGNQHGDVPSWRTHSRPSHDPWDTVQNDAYNLMDVRPYSRPEQRSSRSVSVETDLGGVEVPDYAILRTTRVEVTSDRSTENWPV